MKLVEMREKEGSHLNHDLDKRLTMYLMRHIKY